MIIGRDFLKENGASIDLQRNKLKLKNSYIITAPEKVHIPGNVQQHIYGVIEGIPNATSGLVRAHTTVTNKGLLMANSLSSAKNGQVVVRMMNAHDKGVTIKNNSKIGIFRPLENSDNVVNLVDGNATCENKNKCSSTENQLSFEQAKEKLRSEVKWGDCDLTTEQQDQLLDVLANTIDAFSLNGELGDCDLMKPKFFSSVDLISGFFQQRLKADLDQLLLSHLKAFNISLPDCRWA